MPVTAWFEPSLARRLGSPLEATKLSKLRGLEDELASHIRYKPYSNGVSYCIRCKVRWPCLGLQLALIDRMILMRVCKRG